jgi:hypothetical protein
VLERATVESLGDVREIFAPGGVEALRRLAEWGTVMERQVNQTGLEVTLGAESLDPDSELHEFFQTRYRTLQRWLGRAIQTGIDRGEFRAGTDAKEVATALIAFLDGIRLQWYFGVVSSLADEVRHHILRQIDDLQP